MHKKLTLMDSKEIIAQSFSFCVQCVLKIKELPASQVASANLLDQQHVLHPASSLAPASDAPAKYSSEIDKRTVWIGASR